jgi:putative transposase
MKAPTRPNETWAMDFVHDQLATGKKIRVLTVVDTFSRFSPIIDPRFSYRAEDVVQSLEWICRSNGHRKTIRRRPGLPFISRNMGLCEKASRWTSHVLASQPTTHLSKP